MDQVTISQQALRLSSTQRRLYDRSFWMVLVDECTICPPVRSKFIIAAQDLGVGEMRANLFENSTYQQDSWQDQRVERCKRMVDCQTRLKLCRDRSTWIVRFEECLSVLLSSYNQDSERVVNRDHCVPFSFSSPNNRYLTLLRMLPTVVLRKMISVAQ